MLQVYTGNGKGKTTAAVGLAVRAVGRGKKVAFFKFLKTEASGEDKVLKSLGVYVRCFGTDRFFNPASPDQETLRAVREGWREVKNFLASPGYDIIILDEINLVLSWEILSVKEITSFLKEISKRVEVVCTGRNAPKELVDAADLVSEVKEVKHYFSKGVLAREGIEF